MDVRPCFAYVLLVWETLIFKKKLQARSPYLCDSSGLSSCFVSPCDVLDPHVPAAMPVWTAHGTSNAGGR